MASMNLFPSSTELRAFFSLTILIIGLGLISLLLVLWRRKRQKLKTPMEFELLRVPGQSLESMREEIGEKLMNVYLLGPLAVVGISCAPWLVRTTGIKTDPVALLSSTGVLLLAGCIWQVGKMASLLDKGAKLRLGEKGERMVGEKLQELMKEGWHVVHDMPAEENGKKFNLDHVVISPLGLAVVETKTRSKPTDVKGVQVVYDGERVSWPRFGNDQKTLIQVRLNAEWLGRLVSRECGITVPVAQVVAIPGWSVKAQVPTNPQVVTGSQAANGVRTALRNQQGRSPEPLTAAQVKMIADMIEKRCRVA